MRLDKNYYNQLILNLNQLNDSRLNNYEIYNKIFERLGKQFDLNDSEAKEHKNTHPPLVVRIKQRVNGALGIGIILVRQIIRIPVYIMQFYFIFKRNRLDNDNASIIAIASNRLSFDGLSSIRNEIYILSNTVGGDGVLPELEEGLQSGGKILLFDPLLESGFWTHRNKCWEDNVYIIDGGYLIFVFIMTGIKSLFLRRGNIISFASGYRSSAGRLKESKNLKNTVIEIMFYWSLINVVQSADKLSAFIYTSNSTLTEMLRCILLQEKCCEKIFEILHGVIASPTEAMFCSILQECNNQNNEPKHLFVPQVPDLPSLKRLGKEYIYKNNVSINAYINQALSYKKNNSGSVEDNYDRLYRYYGLLSADRKRPILTLFGATSLEGNYYDSIGFKFELRIIEMLTNIAKSKNNELNVCYAIHPGNTKMQYYIQDELEKRKIKIVSDSVSMYFLTDYCISVLSSCLFELAWLGVDSFTPLITEDQFYSESYLGLLHHPSTGSIECLEESISLFIDDAKNKKHIDVSLKIRERLEMFLGHNSSVSKKTVLINS